MKFTENLHLYCPVFINNITGLAYNFITKETPAQEQNF